MMGLEENFDKRVAQSPIVKEIIQDLDGLKAGQANLEDKVDNLEKKMEAGFAEAKKDNTRVIQAVNELKDVVVSNEKQSLKDELKKTSDALDRKNSNGDKVKNGSIITLLGTVAYFTFDKFGTILAG